MKNDRKSLTILALNEINVHYIKKYIKKGFLNNFKRLIDIKCIQTKSEDKYEYLEPWIQWFSFYTGLSYNEHKVFRLGDCEKIKDKKTIFEEAEEFGFNVGVVGAFNASNNLKNTKLFIPDAWSTATCKGSYFEQMAHRVIKQAVNNNSNKSLSFKSYFQLLFLCIYYIDSLLFKNLLKLLINIKKPGSKSNFLDILLFSLFRKCKSNKNIDFGFLFLNSGAHVQHHYLFNSESYEGANTNPDWYCRPDYDPLYQTLLAYDSIIGRLLKMNTSILCITGLSQEPNSIREYYWRPKNHFEFLSELGIKNFSKIIPKMSRDFLVEFDNPNDALDATNLLNSFKCDQGSKIFNCDNRGSSIFVELIFSREINYKAFFKSESSNKITNLSNKLSFVAIKNGKHNQRGYVFGHVPSNFGEEEYIWDLKQKLIAFLTPSTS